MSGSAQLIDGGDDPWVRQHALARTTLGWAAVSIGLGAAWARRDDPWWRAFGRQHLGWGVVDVGIVGVALGLQRRRMRRAVDPWAVTILTAERRALRRVLAISTAADVGYCLLGLALARGRRPDRRRTGSGVAIMIQGGFLLAHDGWHLVRSRPAGPRAGVAAADR